MRRVVEQHVHPSYNSSTLFYDIALLKLSAPVPSDVVEPVLLDDGSHDNPGPALLAGWGSLDVQCNEYQTVLQQGPMDIADDETCSEMAGRWYDPATQLCAGRRLEGGLRVDFGRMWRQRRPAVCRHGGGRESSGRAAAAVGAGWHRELGIRQHAGCVYACQRLQGLDQCVRRSVNTSSAFCFRRAHSHTHTLSLSLSHSRE